MFRNVSKNLLRLLAKKNPRKMESASFKSCGLMPIPIKWVIPGYEYLVAACDHDGVFPEAIAYLDENKIPLAGAVHDFTCPRTGKNYMFFPIRKL